MRVIFIESGSLNSVYCAGVDEHNFQYYNYIKWYFVIEIQSPRANRSFLTAIPIDFTGVIIGLLDQA